METWATGVSVRPAIEVYVGDGYVETHYEYSYYATFKEAKDCLLSIISQCGITLLEENGPHESITDTATATIELLRLKEEDVEGIRLCDIQGQFAFFIKKGELNEKEYKDDSGIHFELVADHRHCTPEFCFGRVPNKN